jgi:serine O-acetyltransferase
MAQTAAHLKSIDPVWDKMVRQAQSALAQEPLLGRYDPLQHSASQQLGASPVLPYCAEAGISRNARANAARNCDHTIQSEGLGPIRAPISWRCVNAIQPCHNLTQPLLFFKGFQAIQAYRVGHALWCDGRKDLAYFFQSRISEVFGIDIHPAAVIGRGLMIDHAHSIVIGETACGGRQCLNAALGNFGRHGQTR